MVKNNKRSWRKNLHYTRLDWLVIGINVAVLTLFLVIIVYPLLYVVFASFSNALPGLALIPKQWSLEGYRAVFNYRYIWIGYRNSLVYMLLGTVIALVVTICCAYPLSRPNLRYKKVVTGLCLFTMYFSGGLIPTFLWIKDIGLYDSMWALILPSSLSVYNMIVMRSYFSASIPAELQEAASLDGCGDLRYLLRIVLPLSGSILAVVALFYAVDKWNSFFDAMIYIQSREKLPLANILREILVNNSMVGMNAVEYFDSNTMARMEERAEVMKYAVIIVSSLPMMLIYPFVQKYFVKGVMIGAVKG